MISRIVVKDLNQIFCNLFHIIACSASYCINIAIVLLTLFILSACNNSEHCFTTPSGLYNSDNISNTNSVTVSIPASGLNSTAGIGSGTGANTYGQWTSSGVSISKNDQVSITASGTVILAPPFGLSSSSQSSNNIAGDYGNAANANQQSVYSSILSNPTASVSNYFANGGQGSEMVIWANASTGVYIMDPSTCTNTNACASNFVSAACQSSCSPYNFTAGQQITISTAICTGPAETDGVGVVSGSSTSSPTKWSWQNGWKYYQPFCYNSNIYNTSTNKECSVGKTCGSNVYTAKCLLNSQNNSYTGMSQTYNNTSNVFNTCCGAVIGSNSGNTASSSCNFSSDGPSTSGNVVYTPSFNCEVNCNYLNANGVTCDASTKTTDINSSGSGCYNSARSGPLKGFVDKGTYCGGGHLTALSFFSSTQVSGTAPSCSFLSSLNKGTLSSNAVPGYMAPVYCGTIDSCWNTEGYRLYALQGSSYTLPSPTTTCSNGCVHLNQSSVSVGGKSFNALGGSILLQIIDPNGQSPSVQGTSDCQNLINNNNSAMSSYSNCMNAINTNSDLVNLSSYLTSTSPNNLFTGSTSLRATALSYSSSVANPSSYRSALENIYNALSNAQIDMTCINQIVQGSSDASYVPPSNGLCAIQCSTNDNAVTKCGSTSTVMNNALTSPSTTAASITNYSSIISDLDALVATLNSTSVINDTNASALNTAITNLENIINNYLISATLSGPLTTPTSVTSTSQCLGVNNNPLSTCSYGSTPITTSTVTQINPTQNSILYILQDLLNQLTIIVQNSASLTSYSSASSPTTSNMQSFQTSLNNAVSNIITNFSTFNTNTQNYSGYNNSAIAISNQNGQVADLIQSVNNNTLGNQIGGYTVYVNGQPMTATNGQYLAAVISTEYPSDCSVAPTTSNGQTTYSLACSTSTILTDGVDANEYNTTINYQAMPATGTIWFLVLGPNATVTGYPQRVGDYSVNISTHTFPLGGFNAFLSPIISSFIGNAQLAVKTIFLNLNCTNSKTANCFNYLLLLRLSLILYIIIYGFCYIFGLADLNATEIFQRGFKIGVIVTLFSPNSFNFFNAYLFQGFLSLSADLIANATGVIPQTITTNGVTTSVLNPFIFLDGPIGILVLDSTTYLKLLGLIFQGVFGIFVFFFLLYGIFCFIQAVFYGIVLYIQSILGIYLCFALAPIFLIFILFKRTAYLAENWFKMMCRFSMQPVILLVGLIFLSGLLSNIITQILNFSVCFKCTIPIQFGIPGYNVANSTLFCIPWFAPWGVDNAGGGSGIPFILVTPIPLILAFCMVTKVMSIYSKQLANEITSSIFSGETMFKSGRKHATPMGEGGLSGGLYNKGKQAMATFRNRQQQGENSLAKRALDVMQKRRAGGANASAASTNNSDLSK